MVERNGGCVVAQRALGVVGLGSTNVTGLRGTHGLAGGYVLVAITQCYALARGKVDAVVASAASQQAWHVLPVVTIGCLVDRRGRTVVALGAVGRALREAYFVVLAFGSSIEEVALLDQLLTHVGLVDHVGVVADCATIHHGRCRACGASECQATVGACEFLAEGVADLIGVAGHAVPGIFAAAVRQHFSVVAGAARVDLDDVAGVGHRSAVRPEVVHCIGGVDHRHRSGCARGVGGRIVRACAGGIATNLDAQAVRQCGVKRQVAQVRLLGQAVGRVNQRCDNILGLGDIAVEGVLVGTITVIHQRTLRVRSREGAAPGRCRGRVARSGGGNGASLLCHGWGGCNQVADPLAGVAIGSGNQFSQSERHIGQTSDGCSRALGLVAQADDGQAIGVRHGELDYRCAGNRHAVDCNLGGQCRPGSCAGIGCGCCIAGDHYLGGSVFTRGTCGTSGTSGTSGTRSTGCAVATSSATHQGCGQKACGCKLSPQRDGSNFFRHFN